MRALTHAGLCDSSLEWLFIDWGGVLTTSIHEAFEQFSVDCGLAPTAIADLLREDEATRQALFAFERGTLGREEFEAFMAERLGTTADGLARRMVQTSTIDEELLDVLPVIRNRGYGVLLLSNSWGEDFYPVERFGDLFDHVVLSQWVGLRKPEPEIFAHALAQAGTTAAETVFVDDLGGNLRPARALGMCTVLHRDSATTRQQLDGLFPAGYRQGQGS